MLNTCWLSRILYPALALFPVVAGSTLLFGETAQADVAIVNGLPSFSVGPLHSGSQSGSSQSGSSQSGNSQSDDSRSGSRYSPNTSSVAPSYSASPNPQSSDCQSGNSQSDDSQSGSRYSPNTSSFAPSYSGSSRSHAGNSYSGCSYAEDKDFAESSYSTPRIQIFTDRIEDSTLINPVIIGVPIRDSRLIHPVIINPPANRNVVIQYGGYGYGRYSSPVQDNPACFTFRSLRPACW